MFFFFVNLTLKMFLFLFLIAIYLMAVNQLKSIQYDCNFNLIIIHSDRRRTNFEQDTTIHVYCTAQYVLQLEFICIKISECDCSLCFTIAFSER